jgi:hypothetical protein
LSVFINLYPLSPLEARMTDDQDFVKPAREAAFAFITARLATRDDAVGDRRALDLTLTEVAEDFVVCGVGDTAVAFTVVVEVLLDMVAGVSGRPVAEVWRRVVGVLSGQ